MLPIVTAVLIQCKNVLSLAAFGAAAPGRLGWRHGWVAARSTPPPKQRRRSTPGSKPAGWAAKQSKQSCHAGKRCHRRRQQFPGGQQSSQGTRVLTEERLGVRAPERGVRHRWLIRGRAAAATPRRGQRPRRLASARHKADWWGSQAHRRKPRPHLRALLLLPSWLRQPSLALSAWVLVPAGGFMCVGKGR